MISWLFIIILSYLFFALFSFGDKLILAGESNPRTYTFYVGLLNVLVALFIPFAHFTIPQFGSWIWIILDAIVFILGLYWMFSALEKFDVSNVMPAIGATQPLLIFLFTSIFFGFQLIAPKDIVAFVILIMGTYIVSREREVGQGGGYWKLVALSSVMFSLDFVFAKLVFERESFLTGLIWMKMGSFLIVLAFLFSRKLRKEIFANNPSLRKKGGLLFFSTQASGGIANILQSFAISLAPIGYLAIMNALRGIQFIFLFIITLSFSIFFPRIFKEKISAKIIARKAGAIVLIVGGLAILVL